jgi:AcrR family transcriptional regulator
MNHLMATKGRVEPAQSLREAHTADTRRRIVDALGELLVEEHPATLSMPAVAQRAGVSVATVYRYFPTKGALLDAGTELADGVADGLGVPTAEHARADVLEPFLLAAARHVSRHAALIQSQLASPVGRDIRRRRLGRRLEQVGTVLERDGLDLTDPEVVRLAHLAVTLIGSGTMLELLERQGLSPARVAADLSWAIEALTEATRTEVRRRTTPATTRRAR